MLAYIFWHWPRDEIGTEAYERSLVGFHETLAKSCLEGFHGSLTFRVEDAPWVGPESRGYEDWYLVEGSAALDPLNEIAVSGNRKEPHDRAAHASAGGAGGLYRIRTGDPETVRSRSAIWLTKPRGTSYEDFYNRLEPWTENEETSLWRRQMVLGPAPEFCLFGNGELESLAGLEPVTPDRTLLWPAMT